MCSTSYLEMTGRRALLYTMPNQPQRTAGAETRTFLNITTITSTINHTMFPVKFDRNNSKFMFCSQI